MQALSFGAKRRRRHSWRDARASDWTVRLGEREFKLHRWQLLQTSGFFDGHIQDGFGATSTDLTPVLPRAAWRAFEACLDHVYDEAGTADLAAELVMPLMKIADILDIESLFTKANERAKELLRAAPAALLHGAEGLLEAAGDKLRALYEQALEAVRTRFEDITRDRDQVEALLGVHPAMVSELLSADLLEVESEDTVLRFIERYAARWRAPSDAGGAADAAEEGLLWRLLRVPCLGAEGLLRLRRMGLEQRVGLPVQRGMWMRLARMELRDGGQELERLAREEPELSSWCKPRLALRPVVVKKTCGRELTPLLVGSRPLQAIKNYGCAFDVRLNGQPEFILGFCFDSPTVLSNRHAWESVRYLAANSDGQLNGGGGGKRAACTGEMKACPGARKGYEVLGSRSGPTSTERRAPLEEGDMLRVVLTPEARLLIRVNGVPTVSAELASFLLDLGPPGERRQKAEVLPDVTSIEVYPMVGVPDLGAVTLTPAAAC